MGVSSGAVWAYGGGVMNWRKTFILIGVSNGATIVIAMVLIGWIFTLPLSPFRVGMIVMNIGTACVSSWNIGRIQHYWTTLKTLEERL